MDQKQKIQAPWSLLRVRTRL